MLRREKSQDWLDRLGKESWHLELLISGFSIFLLVQGVTAIETRITLFTNHTEFVDSTFMIVLNSYLRLLQVGMKALMYNLLIHLILRGLWIGAVGLWTVNRNTDLSQLGYTPFFTRVLRRNTMTLDRYIISLDKVYSSIFAFSYLIVFVALCMGLYLGLMSITTQAIFWLNGSDISGYWIYLSALWNILIVTVSIFYIIDFAFMGAMKKVEGLDRIYYPFYKFLSWISLSFIYRTLYYTMLGKKFSRRFIWFIVPFFILLFIGDSFYFRTQPYIPKSSNPRSIIPTYYDDQRDGLTVRLASTPSRYVRDGVVEIFIPIRLKGLGKKIKRHCPDMKPLYTSQFTSDIWANDVDFKWVETEEEVRPYLDCLQHLFDIQLDGSPVDTRPFFHQHPQTTQYGLLHVLDIDTLPRGVHQIEIGLIDSKRVADQDSVFYQPYALFPVWKI